MCRSHIIVIIWSDVDIGPLKGFLHASTYYKESLYFHELDDEGVTVLKPGYDSNCIGLIQSVSQLQTMREFAWEAFSDVFT